MFNAISGNHKIKIPPSGIFTLKTTFGNLKLKTNQTSYISQLLFWNGYTQFEYSVIFEKLIRRCSVFIDIGSNIGYYSVLAAKSNPNVSVYAIEPAHGPKHFLKENVALNHLTTSIKCFDFAISDTTGLIEFYEVESKKYKYLKYNLAGEGNAGTKTTSRDFRKTKVESIPLSAFLEKEGLTEVDLIKIDTEGTEVQILNSGIEFISKYQPIIICETLYDKIEGKLDAFFNALNYDMYNHTVSGLKKVKSIIRSNDDGIRNCFFVPKSKTEMISEFITEN